jgi:protein-disulfide isomerase
MLKTMSCALAALALTFAPALAVEAPKPDGDVDMAKALDAAGFAPVVTLGKADAKATVVEFGSYTCSHCADFATNIFPQFKTTYVDTGKARFVFRDFARNSVDVAAALAVRCGVTETNPELAWTRAELLFQKQKDWAFGEKPINAMIETLKPTGLTEEAAHGCLTDEARFKAAIAETEREGDLGVEGTPAFAINGKLYIGAPSFEELTAILDAPAKAD